VDGIPTTSACDALNHDRPRAVGRNDDAVWQIRGALGLTATTTFALVPALSQTANIIDIYNTSGVLSSVFTCRRQLRLGLNVAPQQRSACRGNALISGNIIGANIIATAPEQHRP